MPDPNKELDKNEKLELEYHDRIDDINSSFDKRYDAQNMPVFPNERNKDMVGDQDTFASRGGGFNEKAVQNLRNKRVASMNVAKKFSMLDIAYGFGLDFNKHEGGK
tara:strand:+ start:586 stop:903 length:318 start_codon:yes stop_codon:yes gene_type:complete